MDITLKNPTGSTQILQNSYWNNLTRMGLEQSMLDTAQSLVASNAKLADDFDASVSAVNQDGDLSAQGRASRLLNLSEKAGKAIDSASRPTLSALAGQIAEHQAALKKAASGPDASAVSELRAAEVRREFAKHDPLNRPFEYDRLIQAGRYEAAIAIEQAPGAPLIDAETAAAGQANRGARTLPERAIAMQAAQDAYDLLVDSTRAAKRHVALAPINGGLDVASAGINQDDDEGMAA